MNIQELKERMLAAKEAKLINLSSESSANEASAISSSYEQQEYNSDDQIHPETPIFSSNVDYGTMDNTTYDNSSTGTLEDIVTLPLKVRAENLITLNEKQSLANTTALSGKSMCLIGAAGTGKTSAMKITTRDLITKGHIPRISEGTRWLRAGAPGIVVLGYTRKAVNNIRRNVVTELKDNTLTIHKILEFAPVKYEIEDTVNGGYKTTMKFEPQRNADNPLPDSLKVVIWEESSMIATELYNQFRAAMKHPFQEIFLGDIQQLPPIFGKAVLGFKMIELPTIELTEVFRQALDSPVLKMAWDILSGDANLFSAKVERYKPDPKVNKTRVRAPALDAYNISHDEYGETRFQYWQVATPIHKAIAATSMLFKDWWTSGYYNPEEDIILCPYNKAETLGCVEINKHISQFLSKHRGAQVHEIIAGFERVYWAVGDRVLHDKEDGFIESILPNPAYLGTNNYATPSIHLDRWGIQQEGPTKDEINKDLESRSTNEEDQAEYFLEGDASLDEIEDKVNAASHIVVVRISHSDELITLNKASELKPITGLLGGYCITIHKSQGSEWDKVFLWLHHTHIKMCQRELIYTAVTRARKYLHIMAETDTFFKACKSQKIKGNTLKEKAVAFMGDLVRGGNDNPKKSEDIDVQKLMDEKKELENGHGRKYSMERVNSLPPARLLQSPMSGEVNEHTQTVIEEPKTQEPSAVPRTHTAEDRRSILMEKLAKMKAMKGKSVTSERSI